MLKVERLHHLLALQRKREFLPAAFQSRVMKSHSQSHAQSHSQSRVMKSHAVQKSNVQTFTQKITLAQGLLVQLNLAYKGAALLIVKRQMAH
jgi:hypothetical protein